MTHHNEFDKALVVLGLIYALLVNTWHPIFFMFIFCLMGSNIHIGNGDSKKESSKQVEEPPVEESSNLAKEIGHGID